MRSFEPAGTWRFAARPAQDAASQRSPRLAGTSRHQARTNRRMDHSHAWPRHGGKRPSTVLGWAATDVCARYGRKRPSGGFRRAAMDVCARYGRKRPSAGFGRAAMDVCARYRRKPSAQRWTFAAPRTTRLSSSCGVTRGTRRRSITSYPLGSQAHGHRQKHRTLRGFPKLGNCSPRSPARPRGAPAGRARRPSWVAGIGGSGGSLPPGLRGLGVLTSGLSDTLRRSWIGSCPVEGRFVRWTRLGASASPRR